MERKWALAAFAALALAIGAPSAIAASGAGSTPPSPSIATFEGKQIDLSKGWGDAQACLVYRAAGLVECFRDRVSLDAREQQLDAQISTDSVATASTTCSTPLRLFADAGYGGRELDFYDRGYWQNLSTWSFDNQLSSYKTGACAVYLADSTNGDGSWYPGTTSANHGESSMLSGNRPSHRTSIPRCVNSRIEPRRSRKASCKSACFVARPGASDRRLASHPACIPRETSPEIPARRRS